MLRRVNAYHSFIEGVKDGIFLFSDIYPALLAMMCAITLLRESGLMEVICNGLLPILKEFLKRYGRWSFFRPISGNASLAVLVDIFKLVELIL